MNFDFSLVLAIGSAITGGIWLLDYLLFANKRKQVVDKIENGGRERDEYTGEAREPILVEYARFLFPVFFIVLLLRGFIVEPFKIPSGSMIPTLEIGDFILVSKFSYGLRVPVINQKILSLGRPSRGDVAVFRYPQDPSIDYIKRVVGLPGDEIGYHNKQIFVNGTPVSVKEVTRDYSFGEHIVFKEKLGKVEHVMQINTQPPRYDFVTTVPDNMYFVMGDNRDNSNDSRVWGFVPDANLKGRAFFIWMNWQGWTSMPRWKRIGPIR